MPFILLARREKAVSDPITAGETASPVVPPPTAPLS